MNPLHPSVTTTGDYTPLVGDNPRDLEIKRNIMRHVGELQESIRRSGFINPEGESDIKTNQIINWISASLESLWSSDHPEIDWETCLNDLKNILTHDGTNHMIPLEADTVLGSDGHAYGSKLLAIYQMSVQESIRYLSPLRYREDPTPLTTRPHIVVRDTINWLYVKYGINIHSREIERQYALLFTERLQIRQSQTQEARIARQQAIQAQLREEEALAQRAALNESVTLGAEALTRTTVALRAGVATVTGFEDLAEDTVLEGATTITPLDVARGLLQDETPLIAQLTENMRIALNPVFERLTTENETTTAYHAALLDAAPQRIDQLRQMIQTFNHNTEIIRKQNEESIAKLEILKSAQDEISKQLKPLDAQITKIKEAQKEIDEPPPNAWITFACAIALGAITFGLSTAGGALLGLHTAAGGAMGAWMGNDLQNRGHLFENNR